MRAMRNRVGLELPIVTAATVLLMMVADHGLGIGEPRGAVNDVEAVRDMFLHLGVLLVVQFPGLQQDVIGNAYFADIVQERALDRRLDGLGVEPHRFGEAYGVLW